MKIIYVHHALRDKGNPPTQNDGIKELGKKDAEIVAELLLQAKQSNINIKAIYTSPFKRCMQTSQILNKSLNIKIFEDNRLNEFGSIKNETWVECQTRIRNLICEIVNNYNQNDAVVCVTSGVNVAAFISLAYKLKPSSEAPFIGIPSCSPLSFEISKENFNSET